jgi:TonB family protein
LPLRSHGEDFGKMIRPPFSIKGFPLALIISGAIHVALLPVLLSLASGPAQRDAPPITENCIRAFLVPGTFAAAGKKAALPGRERREADRGGALVTAALQRDLPEYVPPAEKEGDKLLADIRPPVQWSGSEKDEGGLPVSVVLFPGDGDLSGSNGASSTAVRREIRESAGGSGEGVPASRREGTGKTPQEAGGVWFPKNADAVPRYGDNVRPAYPTLARLRGYQGVVVLFVEVLVDGRVGQVRIRRSAGHEILDRAAREAVSMWRFEPGRREGRAVTMSVEVPVRFVLNEYSAR